MRKAVLYIALGLLAVLMIGGVAAGTTYYLMQGRMAEASTEERGVPDLEERAVVALEPFVTNLADEERRRYINVRFELVVATERQAEKVRANLPLIRDAILGILNSKNSMEVTGPDGSNTLKEEIQVRVNDLFGGEFVVQQVLITDFVVQF